MKKSSRILSALLAALLCLTLLPLGALADGEIEETPAEAVEEIAEEPAVEEIAEEIAEEPAAEEIAEEPAVEEIAEEPAVEEIAEEIAEEPAADEGEETPATDGITTYMGKTNDDWAYVTPGWAILENGQVTLRVVVDTNRTNVTYAWSVRTDDNVEPEVIPGATSAFYTATKTGVYFCTVTDGSGNVCEVSAEVISEHSSVFYYVHPDGAEGDWLTVTADVGSSVKLTTVVEGDDLTNLTYEWYSGEYGPKGELVSEEGSTYTLNNVTESVDYWCRVYKDGEYIGTAWFYINTRTNVTAYPYGGKEGETHQEVSVDIGGSATLRVVASAADGSALYYTWSYYDETEDEWVEVEGTDTFKVENITESSYYHCWIRDENWNSADVGFSIRVDNHLEVHPAGSSTNYVTLTGKPGSAFTLEVTATADDTSSLRYEWTNASGDSWYEDLTGSSNKLLVEYVPESVTYICYVTDGYDGWEYVVFHLIISDTPAGTWKKSSGGWWYRFEDGTYPKSQMLEIDGKKYYFNASGYLYSGWKQVWGDWYYFTSSGAVTGWKKLSGSWYFFDTDGVMYKGWLTDGGTRYYFKSSGAMATGWQQIGSAWYYFASSGAMKKSSWLQSGSSWYYFGSDGKMYTGRKTIGSSEYYFASSGAMKTGWQQIGSAWYYFTSSGAMKKSSWLKSGGSWYYLKADGAMAANETLTIDGKNYRFNASGVWVS